MTQVRADLFSLHGLYCWTAVGGRRDLSRTWIHNTQGVMHRSGAKYMADVHGRKGVLFCIPTKKSQRLSRLVMAQPVRGGVLRVGARAYGFPFVLNVLLGDRQVFSKTIGRDAWEDLAVPLPAEGEQGETLTLELVIPEDQRWREGAFFDYVDVFGAAAASPGAQSRPTSRPLRGARARELPPRSKAAMTAAPPSGQGGTEP